MNAFVKRAATLALALQLGSFGLASANTTASSPMFFGLPSFFFPHFYMMQTADTLRWEAKTHDFGTIKQNVPVTAEFTCVNKTKKPIIITSVVGSCGCTTPEWSKDPIAPGKKGSIKATYNAASIGQFNKTVTVTIQGQAEPVVLTLTGVVQ